MNLIVLLALLSAPEVSDLDGALERLASPQASERQSAGRWLATHLERAHYARLAETAASGSEEVRARLADALSADRNLGLSALMLNEDDASLRELGQGALTRSLSRWYGESELDWVAPSLRRRNRLARAFPAAYRLDPTAERLDVTLDRIARQTDAELIDSPEPRFVSLVIDPMLSSRPPPVPDRAPREIVGNFGTLLIETAKLWEVPMVVVGIEAVAGLDTRHPVVFVSSEEFAGTSWFDQMSGWVRELERSGPLAAGAARALANSRWPAAMAWIEERWTESGDPAFLEGLLAAAGRGRVAPSLVRGESVRHLSRLAFDAGNESWRTDQLVRALIAIGGTGSDGEDMTGFLLEGWSGADEGERRVCMRVLSGWGRAPDRLRDQWRGWLESDDGRVSARLGLESLFALAHTAPGPLEDLRLSPGTALLEYAHSVGRLAQLLAWVRRLQAPIPASWREVPGVDVQLILLAHELGDRHTGSADRAAEIVSRLQALGVGEERLGEVLRRAKRRAGEERARGVISALARSDPRPSRPLTLERLALLAGVPLPGTNQVLTQDLAGRDDFSRADWQVAGALLAFPDGDAAGELLVEGVRQAIADWKKGDPGMESAWVEGCLRAHDDLRARRDDARAEALLKTLRSSSRRSRHPIRSALIENPPWPLSPSREPRSLEDFGALGPR